MVNKLLSIRKIINLRYLFYIYNFQFIRGYFYKMGDKLLKYHHIYIYIYRCVCVCMCVCVCVCVRAYIYIYIYAKINTSGKEFVCVRIYIYIYIYIYAKMNISEKEFECGILDCIFLQLSSTHVSDVSVVFWRLKRLGQFFWVS